MLKTENHSDDPLSGSRLSINKTNFFDVQMWFLSGEIPQTQKKILGSYEKLSMI